MCVPKLTRRQCTSSLYTSQAAEQLPCSARAIVYCPLAAAALIGLQLKRFVMDHPLKKEILFDLPTLTLVVTLVVT